MTKQSQVTPLTYRDTKTAGTPVILIHAYPLNQNMWAEQVTALKESGKRVITFDIRGFGQAKLESPYTLEHVVDDLIQLMDELKIDKAVLGGLSMGGYVALRAIERNPDRFKALILADTKSEADSDEAKLSRYKGLVSIEKEGVKNFNDGFVKKALSPHTLKEKPSVFEKASAIANENKKESVAAGLLALISRTDTTPSLEKIKVPTLIIQGDDDQLTPMKGAKLMNEKIKGSKLVVIPKTGHLSNLENPEAFNSALLEFVKAH